MSNLRTPKENLKGEKRKEERKHRDHLEKDLHVLKVSTSVFSKMLGMSIRGEVVNVNSSGVRIDLPVAAKTVKGKRQLFINMGKGDLVGSVIYVQEQEAKKCSVGIRFYEASSLQMIQEFFAGSHRP